MNLFRSVCRLILRGVGPFALLLFCVAQNQPAHATGSTLGLESYLAGATSILPNRRKAWNFNLGIGVGTAPEYIGGKDYEPVVLPLIDIDWRGRVFASTQRGQSQVATPSTTMPISVSPEAPPAWLRSLPRPACVMPAPRLISSTCLANGSMQRSMPS